ncbi:MAG: hypothetical protein H6Q84_904 [Deltaproteobacteria bacterium]|nr:hypothetical protein [Deltaproteobacteria bacterium]
MIGKRLAALVLAPVLLLSGCGSLGPVYTYRSFGLLYTHTVRPLTRHRDTVTVVPTGAASGNMKQIHFQYVSIEWDDNAIGEIAKKGGIETIHFADLETRSYVLNIWTRHTVHVYGTAAKPPAAPPPTGADSGP